MTSSLADNPCLLALLDSVRQEPQDDGPRLVLADWLEDAGDVHRSEFIRLQCSLGPGSRLPDQQERHRVRERVSELLMRFGGAWLGPLWRHGGLWHRGLLTVELDRLRAPGGLEEMLPWVDSIHFEVPGREALRWALALAHARNHVTLLLRRPFVAETLLDLLGEVPFSPCLRTLTFSWAPGMGRRTEAGVVPRLHEDFFADLVRLPVGRHLSHLGSIFRLTEEQSVVLRSAGVEPVLARDRYWPHSLPPAVFRR